MIQDVFEKYLAIFPEEREAFAPLLGQVAAGQAVNDRSNFEGHITGSAYVLSPDNSKILVVYHKLFQKWLQPGGHWEQDEEGPWVAARREAEEETGVAIAGQLATFGDDTRIPLDCGAHPIMNRPQKHEPAHIHYDMRYVFLAVDESLNPRTQEVNIAEAGWMPLDDERLTYLAKGIAKLRAYDIAV